MKNYILILLCSTVLSLSACERNDIPIPLNQVPASAQDLVKTHFPSTEVSVILKDVDGFRVSYDIIFVNGDKVECNKSGEWTEVECKTSQVPNAIIPAKIKNFVTKNHDNQRIIQIKASREFELDKEYYEVKLQNNIEIIFDKNQNFLRYDD